MSTLIHEGRKVKRIREILHVKQEALADALGISQQSISLIEQREKIDDELMKQIANVLKVPVEAIRNFNEDAAVNYITGTVNNHDHSINQPAVVHYSPIINPMDKIIELYEIRIKEKDDIIKDLKERLSAVSGK